ncbi:hypothetical protein VPHD479_0100 [Vibrio phage D479]
MITITYDPVNGAAVPDGAAWDFGQEFVADPRDVTIGTENMLYAIRIAVRRGQVDHKNLRVQFGNKFASIDKLGALDMWPRSMPIERFLDELCFDDEKDHSDFVEFNIGD